MRVAQQVLSSKHRVIVDEPEPRGRHDVNSAYSTAMIVWVISLPLHFRCTSSSRRLFQFDPVVTKDPRDKHVGLAYGHENS